MKSIKIISLSVLSILFFFNNIVEAQSRKSKQANVATLNDVTTPLHMLKPDYTILYGAPSANDVKAVMDRVLQYIDNNTPTEIENKKSGARVELSNIDTDSQLRQGKFRLTSYEWGVTYSAMLAAGQATGDRRYSDYAKNRMQYIADAAEAFRHLMDSTGYIEPNLRPMLMPQALDDCGAICAAMMKAQMANPRMNLNKQIDIYFKRVMYDEYRLSDGTLARCRPLYNTLWLDDMFMGIPSIALQGIRTREGRFTAEAVKQIRQFADRMFVAEKGLFRHGWSETMSQHPSFFWARANGWAMLTMCEVLDNLSTGNPSYSYILDLLRQHIASVASLQGIDGFWHQLLDRPETYEETSATAIYTYCITHAINKGWINAQAYGPIAVLGWNAVASKVTAEGLVEGTCVGTGMGFDAAFYAYRPISSAAAHGYGPVIWAGAEMYSMLLNLYPRLNDSAVHFYDKEQQGGGAGIYGVADPSRPVEMVAGATRKENRPVMFIIGDSTVKNGRGEGAGDMWGWASFFDKFVDTTKVSIENHALGGRSSRTFITEGLWNKVLGGIKQGDYLLVQFGHNDGGPLGTGRARASLKGTGNESEMVTLERNGGIEQVYTYGHYMRTYIRQAKAKGAIVIVLSHTPGNHWDNDKIRRCTETYAAWTKQVAQEEDVFYIDENTLAANEFDKEGQKCAKKYFKDSVHNSYEGAILNCKCVANGLLSLNDSKITEMIKRDAIDKEYNIATKPLYRDPEQDGAADPVIVWNNVKQCHTMFYTNRRAKLDNKSGVEWVHGTKIGMAESFDGGNTWTYTGTANFIGYGDETTTYWAPDIIKNGGTYHMFVTIVPGIFADWRHPRHIVHFTSNDLLNWNFADELKLASDKVIDAGIVKDGNRWLLYYNNEAAGKSIFCAESKDLKTWNDLGLMIGDRGCEGPKIFAWKNRYFMIVDNWAGLAVYQSTDKMHWIRQHNNILAEPGFGLDDNVMGGHCDVQVNGDKAYIFYFTHPGRAVKGAPDNYESRRSSIQVAELKFDKGQVTCDRNRQCIVDLAH